MTASAVTATSRVVACVGGDRTRLEARSLPRPAADEILLKLRVVGLCGTDLFKLDTGNAAPGSVLGHELVGEVAEAGAAVSGFNLGDRVVVPHHLPCGSCHLCLSGSETMCPAFTDNLLDPGGFAEWILVRARAVRHAARRLPASLSDESAVFLEPAACVLRGIRRATIAANGVAVVLGGGSMGLLHLLLLRAARPDLSVVVVDPVAERRQLALKLGASAARVPGPDSREIVLAESGDRGADAVFDTVGGSEILCTALELTRRGGTVVLFAHARKGEQANFDINTFFKHEGRLLGTYSGGLGDQSAVFNMLVSGVFDPAPLVTHRLPLNEFERGVALARRREALKILFTPVASSP